MTFVVKTQLLENYGAHCEDGRYASGNAYWKFKGGDDYIVEDVERGADAMAFVMAKYSENNLSYKVIPTEVLLIDQWIDESRTACQHLHRHLPTPWPTRIT